MQSEYSGIKRAGLIKAKRRAAKQGITLDQLVDKMAARYKELQIKLRKEQKERKRRVRKEGLVAITAMVAPSIKRAIEQDAKSRGIDLNRAIRAALHMEYTHLDLMDPSEPKGPYSGKGK